MSAQNSEEDIANRSATMHVVKAAFPEAHPAPWMSVYPKQTEAIVVNLKTVGDVGKELDRRKWLDDQSRNQPELEDAKTWDEVGKLWLEKHPGEQLPSILVRGNGRKTEDAEEEGEPEFDANIVRGGPAMLAFCANALAQNIHDFAPSIDGLRTRQAIGLGGAVKSNITIQPPEKRSLWQKIRGKGGESQQVSTGA
jgi:hypothetical protein